jgi:hypothetical protein
MHIKFRFENLRENKHLGDLDRWEREDNSKINLRKIEHEGVDWIKPAEDRS